MRNPTPTLETVRGFPIWLHDNPHAGTEHVFFRNDLTLDEIPSSAELWIASRSYYQVFINGRFCAAGPTPYPGNRTDTAYVSRVDISHLLEVGANPIAVHVFDPAIPLAPLPKTTKSLWLQIHVNDYPVFWTDDHWLCLDATCFRKTALRVSPTDIQTECFDFDLYPAFWKVCAMKALQEGRDAPLDFRMAIMLGEQEAPEPNPASFEWRPAVQATTAPLDKLPVNPFSGRPPEALRQLRITAMGSVAPKTPSTWLNFEPMRTLRATPGLYAAECHVYSENGGPASGTFHCKDAYRLYINRTLVKQQAVPPPPVRVALDTPPRDQLAVNDIVSASFEVTLNPGWNPITVYQDIPDFNSGFQLNWTELPGDGLSFHQKPDTDSPAGWLAAGPFHAPLSLIYAGFPLDQQPKVSILSGQQPVFDPSTYYETCAFTPSETPPRMPIELKEGNVIILDAKKTIYATLSLALSGNAGDIIDVVFGDVIANSMVLSYMPNILRRNALTIILRQGKAGTCDTWFSSAPKGFRYLMLVVRKAADTVRIREITPWLHRYAAKPLGEFSCSSRTLNTIWKIGEDTLGSTMTSQFMTSPSTDTTQGVADAMIQSAAAYHVYGAFDMAGQALQAFALSQLETGDINALSPSGLFQCVPDYSLLWPVWLKRHILYTNDMALLKQLYPVMENLLHFYDTIGGKHDALIPPLKDYNGLHCFLDHGPIDRQGVSTALNAIYCRALLSAAWLSEQLNLKERAILYMHRASRIARKLRQLTWNDENRLFADGYHDKAQSPFSSWQTNVLAIWGGVATSDQIPLIWEQLFSDDAPFEKLVDIDTNNPYFKYFLLEAAFALGKRDWALALMKHYWGSMARDGAVTWWELYDPNHAPGQLNLCSPCHGYGVSPNIFLISELVGIRPALPGMKTVYFNPLPGKTTWVKAQIPTPTGPLSVEWKLLEDGSFEAAIGAQSHISVIPIMPPELAEKTTLNVNDKVTILQEEE